MLADIDHLAVVIWGGRGRGSEKENSNKLVRQDDL